MGTPSRPFRRLPALAASCVLAGTAAARAQDAGAQDAGAPPKPAAPAPAKATEFLASDLVRTPDGLLVKYYRTKYVAPEVLKDELKPWQGAAQFEVSGGRYGVASDPPGPQSTASPRPKGGTAVANNVLRITTPEDHWPVLERVLAMLDIPQPQVQVDARVLELTYDDQLRVGVTSKITKPVGDAFLRSIDAKFPNPIDAVNGTTAVFRSNEKYLVFDYALDAVEQGAVAEVMSKPSILVSQGDTAVIRSGEDEPFIQQTVQGISVQTTTTFKPVGVTLEVQPLYVGNGAVRVRIGAEASRVSDFRTTAITETQQVVNAVVSTRRADTVVTILDGSTIVLGGLEQKSSREQRTGVPFVSKIPVLGWFFGSTTKRDVKTELFFWIKLTIETPESARILEPTPEK